MIDRKILLGVSKSAYTLGTFVVSEEVIRTALKEVLPEADTPIKKAMYILGIGAISAYLADKVSNHAGESFDKMANTVQQVKKSYIEVPTQAVTE